jgi:ThiF family
MTAIDELNRTILLCRDYVSDELSDAEICEHFQSLRVLCISDQRNLSSHSGQTALGTLVFLLSRMGMQVVLKIPEGPIISPQAPLPDSSSLRDALLASSERLVSGATVRMGSASHADLVFALGDTHIGDAAVPCWRLCGDDWCGSLAIEGVSTAHTWNADWPVGAMVSAAQAASEAFKFVMRQLRFRNETDRVFFELSGSCIWNFGPVQLLDQDLDLGNVDIISAGAISQAALHVLTRLPKVRMHGRIFDDDLTAASNLNRNMLSLKSDVGAAKVHVAAQRCGPNLLLEPIVGRYPGENLNNGNLAARVLVGVDDIPSRWKVQRFAPGWLAVSGTSHFNVSSSAHAIGEACSGCLHPVDDPGVNPIPTISFVSFWAGLTMVVRLIREALGRPYPPNQQHLWLTPLRMDLPHAAIWSGVPAIRKCPVLCSASQRLLAA